MRGISVVGRLARRGKIGAPILSFAGGIAALSPPSSPYRYLLYHSLSTPFFYNSTFATNGVSIGYNNNHSWQHQVNRNLSSSSSSASPSKTVLIETEDQLNASLKKVQDESLPAVFYFTAVWCGPCKLLSPVLGQLTDKYPNVTTYKIDIDQDGLGNALNKLTISAVPTLHFYKNGTKVAEVVGADIQRLKDTLEASYKE